MTVSSSFRPVVVIALVFSAWPAFAQAPEPPTVVASGQATVKRAPDRAWLTVATDTHDPQADVARQHAAEAMTAVQTSLKQAGVAADAIRTTGFSLSPDLEWNNGRSTMRGYIVHNQIEVRVDNLDRLGAVIDAANASKNTSITLSGPRFDLKDDRAAQAEALRMAVEAAMARATAIATGAHRTLGAIIRITESGPSSMPGPLPMAMRIGGSGLGAPTTPVDPGEVEVDAQVTVTVELK